MLDVLELEKKWSKYHFKKVLPLYITSLILLSIVGVSAYIYIMKPQVIVSLIASEQPSAKVVPIVKAAASTPPVHTVKVQEVYEQNLLVPSFEFIYNLEDQAINFKNTQLLASVKTPIAKVVKKKTVKPAKPIKHVQKPKHKKKPLKKPKKVAKTTKKASIKPQAKKSQTIHKSNVKPVTTVVLGAKSDTIKSDLPTHAVVQVGTSASKDELRSLIKRFNKTQKPALSLFISKKYYEQGNYKEAYTYAKATYKINPRIEDGVLLYAKSLAKLGHIDKASNKLKAYIKKSGSVKAKILLNDIQKGNFK